MSFQSQILVLNHPNSHNQHAYSKLGICQIYYKIRLYLVLTEQHRSQDKKLE